MRKIIKQFIINALSFFLMLFTISCSKDSDLLPAEIALQDTEGLQVGVAMVNVTPDAPAKVNLEGYGDPRQATGVHDSLTARCMIINDGNSVVALVSLDFIGLFWLHVDVMKKMIAQETGLKEENIFIHSIHTHSGPDILGNYLLNGSYREEVNKKVTNCILNAFTNRKKVIAFISAGNSQVKTVNRRNPQKLLTNQFTTIEFQDSAQHTIAMLLNFGCHPVVLGPDNLKISADYVYYLREKVEREKGGLALFFNSRFGDINPPLLNGRTNAYSRDGGTFEMAQTMGEQLANDMLNANLDNEPISIFIKTSSKTIKIKQLEYSNHTHISLLDLGLLQMAILPGEPLEGFADQIETLLPGPYKMVIGQTNDAIGYIVPEKEWNGCKNSFISTCYEETVCADSSVAGKLENGFKELLNQ